MDKSGLEWLRPFYTVLLALLVSGIIMEASGYNAVNVIGALVLGSFGNLQNLAATLVVFVPLALMGVGIALSFQSGLFNIGAQGQYWCGAIVATLAGIHFPGLLPPLHILLALVLAILAGGLYAVLPGVLKAYTGAHEVITTMMLSYTSIDVGHYLIENGPMMMPGPLPQSYPIAPSAVLPLLIPGSQLSYGLGIALAGVAAGAWILYRTRTGLELRMVGQNSKAAGVAGMNVKWLVVLSLVLSGTFAGLAGGIQILGVSHQLLDSFVDQYGFTAIVVALLAKNNPWGVIPAALLFAALNSGAGAMQMNAGIPAQLAEVIMGVIVFLVAADRIVKWLEERLGMSWLSALKKWVVKSRA